MPTRGQGKKASTKKAGPGLKEASSAAPGNRPASYSLHFQPVFTASQKACMSGMINLDDYNDVKANAEDIYSRLADKSMPADNTGPWPNEWITLFRRWIDEGCAP
jgi:hypothetical protein